MLTDENGFYVQEELPLNEFIKPEWAPGNMGMYDECIHVFPRFQSQKMTLYRMVDSIRERDIGDPIRRIKTEIQDVKFNNYLESDREIDYWCLQSGDGETLMTFLTALAWERSPARLHVEYSEVNNSQYMDEKGVKGDTLIFKYNTESGRRNAIKIDQLYSSETTKNATFKES